jgi:hypothetical protein
MSITIDRSNVPTAYGNPGTSEVTQATQTANSNAAPVVSPVALSQAAEAVKPPEPAKTPGGAVAKHRDGVTITYDTTAGVTVLKSFDTKGNLVTQVPPAQLLKTMELEGRNRNETKGLVINTKV